MAQLILILGMHRSGTSLLSRSMTVFGANHSKHTKNKVISCGAANKKGYWEDNDFMNLNNKILKVVNQKWSSVKPLYQSDFNKIFKTEYFDEAKALMTKKFSEHDFIALKEPRITKLLPFWNKVFEELAIDVKYVFAIRHPFNVSQSLRKRNDFSLAYGAHLWYSYNLFALQELAGKEVFFVDYNVFLDDTENTLQRLSTFLDKPISLEDKNIFLNSFIDKNLCSFSGEEDSTKIAPTYVKLYSLLSSHVSPFQVDLTELKTYLNSFEQVNYTCLNSLHAENLRLKREAHKGSFLQKISRFFKFSQ